MSISLMYQTTYDDDGQNHIPTGTPWNTKKNIEAAMDWSLPLALCKTDIATIEKLAKADPLNDAYPALIEAIEKYGYIQLYFE